MQEFNSLSIALCYCNPKCRDPIVELVGDQTYNVTMDEGGRIKHISNI